MKVCILAAGVGSRSFSKDIHKALLPIKNKAVLSHIIEQFPKDAEFVIALGHKAPQIRDFMKIAHPDLKITFLDVNPFEGAGSGPGTSLAACQSFLQEPFYFTACDTLIESKLPDSSQNWIGVSRVRDIEKWCSVETVGDKVTRLHYKIPNVSTDFAFVGLAYVKNYSEFWQALASNEKAGENQVNDGIEALIPHNLLVQETQWKDTGTKDSYLALVKNWGGNFSFTGKTTELTFRYADKIIKFYADASTAKVRFKKAKEFKGIFPEAIDLEGNFLSYRYTEGVPLTETIDAEQCSSFLNWCESKFWRNRDIEPTQWREQVPKFYLKKNPLFKPEYETGNLKINDVSCEPIEALLSQVSTFLQENAHPSTFHGDLHNDNIIRSKDGSFTMIDWRDSFGGCPDVGDRYYDLAKFLHTLDFSVPAMTDGGFSAETIGQKVVIKNDITEFEIQARTAFWQFMKSKNYNAKMANIVNGIVFINMAPLYDSALGIYLYFLGKLTLQKGLLCESK